VSLHAIIRSVGHKAPEHGTDVGRSSLAVSPCQVASGIGESELAKACASRQHKPRNPDG
jgi:hypothetical protein